MNQDNQQETPTEGEIAWLAGAIDCDGTVMLSCHIRKEKVTPKISVEIKLYSTDGGIMTKAVDIITRLGLAHYIYDRPQRTMEMRDGKSYGDICKSMLSVSVKNLRSAYIFAKLLYPWMAGEKASRLALVIQYLARRIDKIDTIGKTKGCRFPELDLGDKNLVVQFYRQFVKRPGHNRQLVEGLLRD